MSGFESTRYADLPEDDPKIRAIEKEVDYRAAMDFLIQEVERNYPGASIDEELLQRLISDVIARKGPAVREREAHEAIKYALKDKGFDAPERKTKWTAYYRAVKSALRNNVLRAGPPPSPKVRRSKAQQGEMLLNPEGQQDDGHEFFIPDEDAKD